MLSMNLTTAMNASFLHPDMFMKGTEWIAPGLSKALSKTILGIVNGLSQVRTQTWLMINNP